MEATNADLRPQRRSLIPRFAVDHGLTARLVAQVQRGRKQPALVGRGLLGDLGPWPDTTPFACARPRQEAVAMPRTQIPSLYDTTLAYLAAGRSIVPVAPGSKAPGLVDHRTGRRTLIAWERYQDEPATPDEVRRWFTGP